MLEIFWFYFEKLLFIDWFFEIRRFKFNENRHMSWFIVIFASKTLNLLLVCFENFQLIVRLEMSMVCCSRINIRDQKFENIVIYDRLTFLNP